MQTKATTDVDRRAFDLLEAMTERRAAELRNQPGPHVDKAVAALHRAFKRHWSPGEERLMANFLAALGAIPQEKLAAEQLRELEAFYNNGQARYAAAAGHGLHLGQGPLELQPPPAGAGPAGMRRSIGTPPAGHGKPLCEQQFFQDYISYLDQAGQYTEP